MTEVPFDPSIRDGRGTRGLSVPKSNWANRLIEPPFTAFGVTCGITFFGGGDSVNHPQSVYQMNTGSV